MQRKLLPQMGSFHLLETLVLTSTGYKVIHIPHVNTEIIVTITGINANPVQNNTGLLMAY